jgi:hypothetical protein
MNFQVASRRKSVIAYAKYIGMDLTGPDRTLLWLAEEGLNAGLPDVGVKFNLYQLVQFI